MMTWTDGGSDKTQLSEKVSFKALCMFYIILVQKYIFICIYIYSVVFPRFFMGKRVVMTFNLAFSCDLYFIVFISWNHLSQYICSNSTTNNLN